MSQLTIVIVTKNRRQLLLGCLTSLIAQVDGRGSAVLKELIIIDNNSVDGTKAAIKSFAQHTKLPIRVVTEKRNGYPVIYNRGLEEATTKWVAFIDDDCIAEPGWIMAVIQSIKKYPTAAAILGKSTTVHTNNVWAMAQYAVDMLWKARSIRGRYVLNYKVLDNKNIMYNKDFLTTFDLGYDETRTATVSGSSEDCDLGMQIQVVHGKAVYEPRMCVQHHDLTTGYAFMRRLLTRARGYMSFQVKWAEYYHTHTIGKNRAISTRRQLLQLKKTYNLSWLFFCQLMLVFSSAMVVSYMFKVPEKILIVRAGYGQK